MILSVNANPATPVPIVTLVREKCSKRMQKYNGAMPFIGLKNLPDLCQK